jgi:hypothetical protein
MILNNENTFLGGLIADIKEIASAILGVIILTAFLGLLIAPMLSPIICANMLRKSCGSGTLEEMDIADRRLRMTRITLWVMCILTWIVTILILSGYNLSNY